jgi:uncharacterized protein YtpQ (UPF0354 family)
MPVITPEDTEATQLIVSQPLVKGLVVAYGLDSDRTISYVTPQRMAQWNVTHDQLHEAALNNLAARSETLNAHAAQDEQESVYLILFQTLDGFDASRILLPNLHEKLRGHLGSPFAAAMPNRDILLCFKNDQPTVEKLLPQVKSDYEQMPHQLSDKILLVTADGIALRSNN